MIVAVAVFTVGYKYTKGLLDLLHRLRGSRNRCKGLKNREEGQGTDCTLSWRGCLSGLSGLIDFLDSILDFIVFFTVSLTHFKNFLQ